MPAMIRCLDHWVTVQPPYIVLFCNTVSEHDAVLSHLQYVRKVVETDDLRNSPQSADSDVARNHRKKYVAHHRGDESLPFDRRCAVSRFLLQFLSFIREPSGYIVELRDSMEHGLKNTGLYCKWGTRAGSDVVQSERPIFDDFFQHLWPYIGNNTANVVFQMVKRLWLIRIDQ
ncbi:hypothetical protein TNCV_3513671 [Trichonephila clavipes]|nr:hypothetical protein TNCV_3513671 [Trichonephila clavipes]